MIRSIILCALVLGVANAARQIVLDPSPPPPGPSTDNVPGALWSVAVPGYSPSTFGTAQQALLCQSMVNKTQSYPRQYIGCTVNSVVQTAGYNSIAAQGQMVWSDFSGSTAADATSRTTSRDLFVNTITQYPDSLVPTVFPGANINDTCNSAFVEPTSGATGFSPAYTVSGMPLTQCRMAVKGTNSEGTAACASAGTQAGLCLTSIPTSTVGAYGMDNGKRCPLGSAFIYPVSAPTAEASGYVSLDITTSTVSGLVQRITFSSLTVAAPWISADFILTESLIRIGGVSLGGITGGSNCDAARVVETLGLPQVVSGVSQGGAAAAGDALSIDVDWSSAGCTTLPVFPASTAYGASGINLAAAWSPFCDSSNAFYQKFQFGAVAPTGGLAYGPVCPRCGGTTTNSVPMKYDSTNAKSLCSSTPSSQGLYVANGPKTTAQAGLTGESCIKIGVANLGSSEPNNGRPMVSTQVPYLGVNSQYTYSFPSNGNVGGTFSPSADPIEKRSYDSRGTPSLPKFQLMAVDSEWNMPCSTPTLVPISSSTNSTGSQGVYLGSVDNAVIGGGSCNTVSKWWNGGTGTSGGNGIDTYSSDAAILKTLFTAPIIGPTPAPAPVAPAPVAPAPVAPVPTPPSPTPLVCTYRGTYEITPLYGPCNKYYIASGTKSNCAENFVHLRTKSNLGGKYDRVRWAIAATAQNGVGTPTRVVAEARSGVGACTNRNLAAPSNPIPGLKVGGSSWQWQFRPYPDSAECDHVNMISENRLDTTAFLSVPKPCKTFRYNESDGGRQRFKLIKV